MKKTTILDLFIENSQKPWTGKNEHFELLDEKWQTWKDSTDVKYFHLTQHFSGSETWAQCLTWKTRDGNHMASLTGSPIISLLYNSTLAAMAG